MILHPSFVLPLMESETPVGYASRMALSMGCSMRAFCNRVKIPMQQLIDGEASAIAVLRHLCQMPESAFADTTYVSAPGHRVFLAGQELSRDLVTREALRVCPVCVEQQLSKGNGVHDAWIPREWYLIPLHVCDVHSVPMLTIVSEDWGRHRQDLAGRFKEAARLGQLRPETTETRTESGLGHHIRRRLRGVADDHWLSQMPLYAAIKTAYMVGSASVHGIGQAWVDLSLADRFEAGRVGFEILKDGEAGLRGLLSEFQRNFYAESNTAGLQSTFGRIYVSMVQGDDVAFDPLRDALRRHIIDTMPFGPGDIVLGREVQERRIHSARTVAPELGMTHPTALRRLRFIGVLDKATQDSALRETTFDAKAHAEDVRRLAGALPRREAGRYLGFQTLYPAVAPILDMVGSMNVDKSNPLDQLYAKEDLDAFLTSVLSKATPGPVESGFEPIADAARSARTSPVTVLDMIRRGEITDIRQSSQHNGLMSLMVRKSDILRVALARRPWLTLIAATKALNMQEPTLAALVRNKIIPSEGVRPIMLKREDLETFNSTYVSRLEVSHQYRQLRSRANRFSVTQAIADVGLEPAFDERKSLIKFYRRDAVLAALGPPPQ